MIKLQTILLAIVLLMPFTVYSGEPEVSEDTQVICKVLALDAVDIGRIYVENHNAEEAARWVVDRIEGDPTFVIFAPGDLQIITTMKNVTIEYDDITRFALAVYKSCTKDDTEGWVQPYKPLSVAPNESPKVSM